MLAIVIPKLLCGTSSIMIVANTFPEPKDSKHRHNKNNVIFFINVSAPTIIT